MKLLVFALVLFSWTANAMILPKNDLHLQDNIRSFTSNIDEETFNKVIDDIVAVYAPIVALHGATLVATKNWENSTVNAYANQTGSQWQIHMYGGLARRSEVTPDGFALVVCHELGHHLAGFPFYSSSSTSWAASEGQSDLFASQVCARKVWKYDYAENAKHRETATDFVKKQCDTVWKTEPGQNLCYRVAAAGQSLANLLSRLGGGQNPDPETPDSRVVTNTNASHPAAQCRMDTYFQGGLCGLTYDLTVIPGKVFTDERNGLAAEEESSLYTCMSVNGHSFGARPRCWFKPRLEAKIDQLFTARR